MNIEIIPEIRNWIIIVLGLIGAIVTLITFNANIRQRKLDNTFKTIEYLRKHITQDQINTFIELFHANNELSGAKYNEFKLKDGRIDTIENMFSEGGCGNGDIHNMIEVFNLISKSLNKKMLSDELIWYEYGQIMSTCYRWTKYLEENNENVVDLTRKEGMKNNDYKKYLKFMKQNLNLMTSFFLDFNRYMGKTKVIRKPMKYYTYIE